MSEIHYSHLTETPQEYRGACLSRLDFRPDILQPILDWQKTGKHFLVITGNVGVGKTYLAWAFHHQWHHLPVRHYEENDFYSDIRKVIKHGWDYQAEINRLCDVPYFIMDDIGTTQGTEWQSEVFFAFINARMKNNKPTIIISNKSFCDIMDKKGERVSSRLEAGRNTLIEIMGDDRRRFKDSHLGVRLRLEA